MQWRMKATLWQVRILAFSFAAVACMILGITTGSCVDRGTEQEEGQATPPPPMQTATPTLTGDDGYEVRAEAINLAGINSPEQARAKLEELGLGYETEAFLEELRHGMEDSFHLYMLAGMDVEVKGGNGVTPLLAAVFGNNPAIVKELLALGADAMARENESEATSLHYAASGDPLKVMQGEGVDAPTREEVSQGTGIHYEVGNAVAIARLLLEHGADIEARDFAQQTPLFVAAKSGVPEVAELLLTQGADIEARDHFQVTPLMISVLGGNQELLQLLEERGADIHAVDEKGANAAWGAVVSIRPQILAYLLSQDVMIDIDSDELFPALHVACGRPVDEGNKADIVEIIRLLLVNGADANARDKQYNSTPLHAAAQAGDAAAVQLLLVHGADVNAIGHAIDGTALHFAASSGSVECVQLLLDNGADIGIGDSEGLEAIDVARNSQQQAHRDEAQLDEDLSLSNSQMTTEDRLFFEQKIAAYDEIIELLDAVGASG